MPEITVTDYDGLEVTAESRVITVTVVDGALVPPTWDNVSGKPTTFPPATHAHDYETAAGAQAKADAAEAAANAYTDAAIADIPGGGGGSTVTVDADGTVTVDATSIELATDAQLAAHEADTTGVHGIADTSALVVTTDARLSDARTPTAHTHPTSEVTGLDEALAGKASTGHNHDDRYYTEAEVDTALAGKAASTHTHAQADVTGLTAALDAKADDADLAAHLNDTTDAHDASAISFTPTGTIAATDVQAAIAEVAAEATGGTGNTLDAPPATPNAKDDEFDGTSSVTWSNTPVAPTQWDTATRPGMAYVRSNGNGTALVGKHQTIPAYPFTATTKVEWSTARGNSHLGGGIFLSEASPTATSNILYLGWVYSSGHLIQRLTYGDFGATSFVSATTAALSPSLLPNGLYLRITATSATSVSTFVSPDGHKWITVDSGINPGFTPGTMGIGLSENGTADLLAGFEYFRVS